MRKLLPLMFVIVTLISGCGREIEDTAYVVAIGVDKSVDAYDFTFAIANPRVVGGDEAEGAPLMFVTASGTDIFTAGATIEGILGDSVNFSHSEVIVFSSAVAEDGVYSLSSSLVRNLSQRPKIIPVISETDAGTVIKSMSPSTESNPERYLTKLLEDKDTAKISSGDNRQLLARTVSGDWGILVPRISPTDAGIEITSLAIMQGGMMIGVTEDIYSPSLMWGNGKMTYPVSDGSLLLEQRRLPKVTVTCGDAPIINIEIPLSATLQTLPQGMSREEMTDVCEAFLARRVNDFLEYTTSQGADVFALGKYGRMQFHTLDAFSAYSWAERYKDATFNVTIDISPSGTSLMKGAK